MPDRRLVIATPKTIDTNTATNSNLSTSQLKLRIAATALGESNARMLPVAYQYTFCGPRSGFNDSKFDRLSMPQSDAVHFLMVGGATSSRPHLHGLEPYPEDLSAH